MAKKKKKQPYTGKVYIIRSFHIFRLAQIDDYFISPLKLLGDIDEMNLYMTQVYPTICHKMYEIWMNKKDLYLGEWGIDYNVFMSDLGQFCEHMCPSTLAAMYSNGLLQTHSYMLAYRRLRQVLKPLREFIDYDNTFNKMFNNPNNIVKEPDI